MTEPLTVRPSPCASCPYRCNVPSGVWEVDEYRKLPAYDGDTAYQSPALFQCHQADGRLCAGWIGHRDPIELLALRMGVTCGTVDPSVFDYRTDVELFSSGADAARHGAAEIEQPSNRARKTIQNIVRKRGKA